MLCRTGTGNKHPGRQIPTIHVSATSSPLTSSSSSSSSSSGHRFLAPASTFDPDVMDMSSPNGFEGNPYGATGDASQHAPEQHPQSIQQQQQQGPNFHQQQQNLNVVQQQQSFHSQQQQHDRDQLLHQLLQQIQQQQTELEKQQQRQLHMENYMRNQEKLQLAKHQNTQSGSSSSSGLVKKVKNLQVGTKTSPSNASNTPNNIPINPPNNPVNPPNNIPQNDFMKSVDEIIKNAGGI